jgi:hypothetical protein
MNADIEKLARESVLSKKEIEIIVATQAMRVHNTEFLKRYGLDDGVSSGLEIALAQALATAKVVEEATLKRVIERIIKEGRELGILDSEYFLAIIKAIKETP